MASLPAPRAVGERAHLDLLIVEDSIGAPFVVAHATDAVSKYQLAARIPNKSSAAVIDFMMQYWWPILGAPRQIIADQGREFISAEFQTFCSAHSVHLWHCAVQAPWQNSPAERSGGILKTLVAAIVTDNVVLGDREISNAIGEACSAYNADVNEEGVTPLQSVTGRQPSSQGSVLHNFSGRLAEHGLIDAEPSLQQRMALRESARIGMIRLHYSKAIRRAELARSREPTISRSIQPGDTVYFWRAQKLNRRGDPRLSTSSRRRRLELRRWHGPAIVLALEQSSEDSAVTNAFLSFKGQVTKCALEHVRPASTLEELSAGAWEEAIKELTSTGRTPLEDLGQAASDAESDEREDPELPEPPMPGAVAPSTLAAPPLTAAPGTPVGHLVRRPVMQNALRRAQGQPLAVELGRQALVRGQPADFAAELRSLMERGRKRSASQSVEPSLLLSEEPVPSSRRVSPTASAGVADPPRLSTEPPADQASVVGAADPHRPSIEPPGDHVSVAGAADPHRPSTEPPGSISAASLPAALGPVVLNDPRLGEARSAFEALTLDHEQLLRLAQGGADLHPLLQVQAQVECDRLQGSVSEKAPDHGTWDGRWSLPSSSQHELLQRLGAPLPAGQPDDVHEVCAAGGRKEKIWSKMSPSERTLWKEAAVKGWSAYVDNDAVKVLSLQESLAVRKELARKGELDRIMTPRFVLTDKNDGLRTEGANLPPAPSARLVVPGFKDRANLEGEIRRDAPTGSRLSQHLLLCLVAYHSATWNLLAADVKSAFLKGDPFVTRELYIGPTNEKTGPEIPLPRGCLAKVLKGVFGLADAPRQWWLKLASSLERRGWVRSALDQAVWFLWSGPERKTLCGMIISHVDDLLLGGNALAEKSLLQVGDELGFREVTRNSFTWCGKFFDKKPDGSVTLSMKTYHENLREVTLSKSRRSDVAALLTPFEHRQLRAVLGSLQWLVAQLRFDLSFCVSSLQGESPPTVGTLLRANQAVREFQKDCNFELVFRGVNPYKGGLMAVADAALGNVDLKGSSQEAPLTKVYSQACYFIILADEELMAGRTGSFNILDMRSHRIPRVCRSSYAAETLSTEEAFDVGQLCRGFLASVRGLPLHKSTLDSSLNSVPLCTVVDAKDVFDRSNNDSNSFGSQKSLAFTIAWLRSVLRRPNTSLMFADGGTKDMDLTHMRSIMAAGKWSVTYSPAFVKQVSKGQRKRAAPTSTAELMGEPLEPGDPLLGHLLKLGEQRGWHHRADMGINVAYDAKSFRSPEPRFSPAQFPLRSTFCRLELQTGQVMWRCLERDCRYQDLANQHELLPHRAPILVTFFTKDSVQ